MKRILLLLTAFAVFSTSFAASVLTGPPKAKDVYVPMANDLQISLKDLSLISVADFQEISGKKLNFFERLSFKAAQRKLKNSIHADGTITNQKLIKAIKADNSVGFHLGGFALGFFVGLIGVLIAYLIKGDEEVDRNRRKWAWIGFGAYLAIFVVAVISLYHSTY